MKTNNYDFVSLIFIPWMPELITFIPSSGKIIYHPNGSEPTRYSLIKQNKQSEEMKDKLNIIHRKHVGTWHRSNEEKNPLISD